MGAVAGDGCNERENVMDEHPTPWRVKASMDHCGEPDFYIVDADDKVVSPDNEDALDRIVAAVNAHDRLVGVLKEAEWGLALGKQLEKEHLDEITRIHEVVEEALAAENKP